MALPRIRTMIAAVAAPAHVAQPVIERAAQLALALEARVILFHAAFDPALSGRPFFDSRRLAKSRGWLLDDRMGQLERHAAGLRRRGLSVSVTCVWEEPVYEAIIRATLREQADLVVAGRHERGGDRAWQWRLTDWELMRRCPRPLLLVRSRARAKRSGAVLAALDPTHAHDKPASLDRSIAQYAAAFAGAMQNDLHVVHCAGSPGYPPAEPTASSRERMRARIRSRLQKVLKEADVAVRRAHILHGAVADNVLALVEKLDAAMLVMGVMSRRGLKRLAIGDTAESIVRAAPCDLLLIKPAGFRLRLGRARKETVVLPASLARRASDVA